MRKICSQRLLQHYERTSSRISTGSPQDLLSKIPSQKKIIQQECFYLSFLKGHDGTNGPNGPNGLNGLNGPLRARLTGSTGSTGPTQQRTMAGMGQQDASHIRLTQSSSNPPDREGGGKLDPRWISKMPATNGLLTAFCTYASETLPSPNPPHSGGRGLNRS